MLFFKPCWVIMTWIVRNRLQITFPSWLTLVKLSWSKLLFHTILCCICLHMILCVTLNCLS